MTTRTFAAGVVAIAIASAGYGSASNISHQYLGPRCSQMDATNSAGYSMCNSHGSACPTGWHAFQNLSGACEPVATSSTSATTGTTPKR
jgi:hypothetical protein